MAASRQILQLFLFILEIRAELLLARWSKVNKKSKNSSRAKALVSFAPLGLTFDVAVNDLVRV